MFKNLSKEVTPLELIFTIVIVALLTVFSVLFVRNVISAHRSGAFANHRPISNLLLKNKAAHATSAKDAEYIDTWMTFKYVNFIFNIPDTYLKDTLQIEDVRYPNLPIGRYTKTQKLDNVLYIKKIKEAVKNYVNTHPSK